MRRRPRLDARPLWVPQGFRFAALATGGKKQGGLDLGLIEAPEGATAAALFTSNRVQAAPLQVGQAHLRRSRGQVRAVIVNSGNANCATGPRGVAAAERICRRLAKLLQVPAAQIFPSSTGVIGVELPVGRIVRALPDLVAARRSSVVGVQRFARAILTTDRRVKLAAARFHVRGKPVTVLGVAKGAGMIHPHLAPLSPRHSRRGRHATMLAYILIDAQIRPSPLSLLLRTAVKRSFHCISVDGDTSTNDTVLLLASGQSGVRMGGGSPRSTTSQFSEALEMVCASLAQQIVGDGEGVRHVVRLQLEGARTTAEAERVVRAVAHSPLVKTAWAGADPNWGRILAAIGASGVRVEPRHLNIYLGSQQVCRRGAACTFDERRAHRELSRPAFTVRIQLNRGRAAMTFWTTDLTAAYVRVNASYRS